MEEKNNNIESAEFILNNILAYSEANGDLLNKYNLEFYLNHFDRNNLLALASGLPPHRPLTQEDFLRLLLLHIPHPPEQTLYLALSLTSLFQSVLERTATASLTIDFTDLTTFLCEKISKEDLDLVVPGQQIVECPPQSPEVSLDAPMMLSRVEHNVPKISRELARKNKKLQEKRTVGKMFYNPVESKIVAVGSLSSTIHLFDLGLNGMGDVRPKECKQLDKEVGILSMGYNATNNRIGVILTSGTLVFWEGSDGFTTQKSIPVRNYGDKVYFLEQVGSWVTVSSNTVHFWDLKEEVVTSSLHVPEASSILDLCQMTHLRSLCISIVGQSQQKFIGVYYQGKRKAVIDCGTAACHSLHYHAGTRTLLPLTYTSSPQIWTIQDLQFDPQLKFVLRGHKSIVTCADSIPDSSILLTGDDAGQIRVWELNYMRCLQSVKLTRWLGGIKLIKDHLLYSDSRINLLPLEQLVPTKPEKQIPIQLAYQSQQRTLWLFTRKEARRVEAASGRAKEIYQIVGEQAEISAAVCIGDGFVVGLSNGQLMRFNSDVHQTWNRQAHEGEIKELLYDSQNRLIWSLGADSRAVAWPERNPHIEEQRKVIMFRRKALVGLSIGQFSTLLVTFHHMDKQLTLWDYQNLALLEVLGMDSPILAVTLSQTIELMLVACVDAPIILLKYSKKEHTLEITKLAELQLKEFSPTSILITHSPDFIQHTVIVATNNGHLLAYDISPLILSQYSEPEDAPLRESVNILRNQKEEFESNYNQRGHTQPCNQLPSITDLRIPMMWSKQIGKQSLLCLSAMNSESVGILSGQYCKVVDKKTGNIKGSLNVSQPLPIKWNRMCDKKEELQQRLYATLKTLDSILTNHGYQMLAREYKMVNVTPFMDQMKNACARYAPSTPLPPLTSDRPLAHPPHSPKEPSLKALEAYKRVKAIKKISQESMQMPSAPPPLQPQLQRDSFLQMFSPNSYSDLLSKYAVQKDPHLKALSSKLTDSLSPKGVRGTMKQNRRQLFDRSSIREGALKDLVKNDKEKWLQKSQHKNIKAILGDLNTKLRQCRLKHSREPEQ